MAKTVLGTTVIKVGENEIDLGQPFVRKSMIELVKEYTGLDFMEADTLEKAKEMAKSVGVDADD